MARSFRRRVADHQGRQPDGYTALAFSMRLDELLDAAHQQVEQGVSIRRDKRLVIVITGLTLQRLDALAARFEHEGVWEHATKSGLANYLINRALPLVEAEMMDPDGVYVLGREPGVERVRVAVGDAQAGEPVTTAQAPTGEGQ